MNNKINSEFNRIFKHINFNEEIERCIASKYTYDKCIECLRVAAEFKWPLSGHFKNIHDAFEKLMQYFDGIKSILELIITNKDDNQLEKSEHDSDLHKRVEETFSATNSFLEKSNSFSENVPCLSELHKPYFELTDRYIEALSKFVSRFDTKEKYYQEKIYELEAHLKLKNEELENLQFDLKLCKQN